MFTNLSCAAAFNLHNDEVGRIANLRSSFVSSPSSTWKAFRKLWRDDTVFIATWRGYVSAKKLINWNMEQTRCFTPVLVLDCISKSISYIQVFSVFMQLHISYFVHLKSWIDILNSISNCSEATVPLPLPSLGTNLRDFSLLCFCHSFSATSFPIYVFSYL